MEKCVDDYRLELGGSGSIFACQCARLGLRTAAVGAVGCDAFGDLFIAALRQAGVSDAYIRRDARLKTGVTAHLVHGSDRAMLTYTGTIDAVTPADVPDAVLGSARHLHISSYYLMRNMTPHFAELARRARALGMTVSLDTNWDPDQTWDGGLWETLRHTDYFLPNENELLRISGERDVEKALSALGCTVPFVKTGRVRGALWARGRSVRLPMWSRRRRDRRGRFVRRGLRLGGASGLAARDMPSCRVHMRKPQCAPRGGHGGAGGLPGGVGAPY